MCILLVEACSFPLQNLVNSQESNWEMFLEKCFWNSFFPECKILLHNFTLVFWGHKSFLQKNNIKKNIIKKEKKKKKKALLILFISL